MPSTLTIEGPITGREAIADSGEPVAALAQFYRAFNTRDLALMAANWAPLDDIAMDNPLGGIARGWPAVRAIYQRLFTGGARVAVEFHDYTLHRCGDVFYAVGRERGLLETDETKLDFAIRTSRVFQRIAGRWRQVHHHGSIDDSRRLDAYQRAVR